MCDPADPAGLNQDFRKQPGQVPRASHMDLERHDRASSGSGASLPQMQAAQGWSVTTSSAAWPRVEFSIRLLPRPCRRIMGAGASSQHGTASQVHLVFGIWRAVACAVSSRKKPEQGLARLLPAGSSGRHRAGFLSRFRHQFLPSALQLLLASSLCQRMTGFRHSCAVPSRCRTELPVSAERPPERSAHLQPGTGAIIALKMPQPGLWKVFDTQASLWTPLSSLACRQAEPCWSKRSPERRHCPRNLFPR